MAHFYANIQGSRGEATRLGTKDSGISGHIRGWHIGGEVYMFHDDEINQDRVTICLTSGSSGASNINKILLGSFSENDLALLEQIIEKDAEAITRTLKTLIVTAKLTQNTTGTQHES